MQTNQQLKDTALKALSGHWKPSVLAVLAYAILTLVANICQVQFNQSSELTGGLFSLAYSILVLGPAVIGLFTAFKRLLDIQDDNITNNMISIALNRYMHNVALYALMILKIFLWTLLLIIPGIIKAISYSMAPFITIEHPEYSPNEVITASNALMKGHKMRFFLLCLSFIGWIILSLLSFGIGFLWLFPYMYTTTAAFYNDIKPQE